jgi:hypothetical protein
MSIHCVTDRLSLLKGQTAGLKKLWTCLPVGRADTFERFDLQALISFAGPILADHDGYPYHPIDRFLKS